MGERVRKLDLIDILALLLISTGIGLFLYGTSLAPPVTFSELIETHFGDWTPGFVTDGVLLLVINRVIHMHERRRVIGQAGSLSNEFALDAVRRCREEGWLLSGDMRNKRFENARLATADFSDATLSGASFRYSDMSDTDLTHANLRNADLTGVNLQDADLRWADLTDARMDWADLRGANLDGAIIENTRFDYASVDSAILSNREVSNVVVGGFMSERQISLIQTSLKKFLDVGDAGIVRFYETLFEFEPTVRSLFPDDVAKQARKFRQSLNVIVSSLTSTEKISRMLHRLGERHQGYGVETGHYRIVGETLVSTLEYELGDDFTAETKLAWQAAFNMISSAMISATRERQAAQSERSH